MDLNLGILCSGGGTNLQAIIDAIESGNLIAKICVVISNNSKAGALERAQKHKIPIAHISGVTHPTNTDDVIADTLSNHGVNFVCLCGYMKPLGMATINRFANRVVNIHPALLPKFGGKGMYGMHVHEAVIAAKEKQSGPTLHVVIGEYDKGPILAQAFVDIDEKDDANSLQEKVLKKEHELYWKTLQQIQTGQITLPS